MPTCLALLPAWTDNEPTFALNYAFIPQSEIRISELGKRCVLPRPAYTADAGLAATGSLGRSIDVQLDGRG